MVQTIWIQVAGFDDLERHSLNTLLRLSAGRDIQYALWTSANTEPPQLALVDLSSSEGEQWIAGPAPAASTRVMCIGENNNHPRHWKHLQRPVQWGQLLSLLDSVFVAAEPITKTLDASAESTVPATVDFCDTVRLPQHAAPVVSRHCLLVGLPHEDALYLRARLALAGLTQVDEVPSTSAAEANVQHTRYALAIVNLLLAEGDPWKLVQTLRTLPGPLVNVILSTEDSSPAVIEQARQAGCLGVLEIPFLPGQVVQLLQGVSVAGSFAR